MRCAGSELGACSKVASVVQQQLGKSAGHPAHQPIIRHAAAAAAAAEQLSSGRHKELVTTVSASYGSM
jgi:hypothetical protein